MSINIVCALVVALLAVLVNGGKAKAAGYVPLFEYQYDLLGRMKQLEWDYQTLVSNLNDGKDQIAKMEGELQASYETISEINDVYNNLEIGSTYIRWGRTTCDGDAEEVYAGFAAGDYHGHQGGGSNYLCLPTTLTPNMTQPIDTNHFGFVYGVEYEMAGELLDNDAPCVVCKIHRAIVLMTPALDTCQDGWVKEYSGVLVTEHYNHHRTEYVCLDTNPEYRVGGEQNQNGALWYYVRAKCGPLPCPPYKEDQELVCVVCSYGKRG